MERRFPRGALGSFGFESVLYYDRHNSYCQAILVDAVEYGIEMRFQSPNFEILPGEIVVDSWSFLCPHARQSFVLYCIVLYCRAGPVLGEIVI
jgi:hypothetical protein